MESEASGLLSWDDVVSQVMSEETAVEAPVIEETPEPIEEQSEQPKTPAKLSDLVEQPESPGTDSDSEAEVEQLYELTDGEKVTLQELKDGYLRRKRFTQGTQELSEERKQLSAATELHDMLIEDPQGTVMALAEQLGIPIEASFAEQYAITGPPQFAANKKTDKVLGKSTEQDIAAIVEAKAKELFESYKKQDPTFERLEIEASLRKADMDMDRISQSYNYPLDEQDRVAILREAMNMQEPNLEFVFLKMRAAVEARQAESKRIKDSSVRKTAATPSVTEADVKADRPKTIDEAWKRAQLILESA